MLYYRVIKSRQRVVSFPRLELFSELGWRQPSDGISGRYPTERLPTNPGYVEAEARIFSDYALSPAVHALSLARPGLRLRAVEVGTGEPTLLLHGFSHCTAHWAPLVSRLSGVRYTWATWLEEGDTKWYDWNYVVHNYPQKDWLKEYRRRRLLVARTNKSLSHDYFFPCGGETLPCIPSYS
jgi:hypothetical protein